MSGTRIAFAAAAAALLLALVPAAQAKKAKLPKCTARAATLKVSTAQIRVFKLHRKLYSCWRPTHRVTLLYPTNSYEDGLLSNAAPPVIVGHYIGFATSQLFDPDGQYDQVFSVNVRYGRSVHRVAPRLDAAADTDIPTFVMDNRGSLAFIQALNLGGGGPCPKGDNIGAAVIAVDRVGTRTLDCESGDEPAGQGISNLTLDGHVVSWQHRGTTASTTLR
ncbi:MAG TPA: hypothetical protein VGI67_11660 [Thermoleophilaceae bacterium]|jgi:hypothetical protein